MHSTVILTFFLLLGISLNAQPVSVFVSAHPDDWQLFMNPNAYHAVSDTNHHVIILHITAGDAGNGMGYNDYTLAREEGSKRAMRFLVKAAYPQANFEDSIITTIKSINNHNLHFYKYRNISSYFLRLPDGNFDGAGYTMHNHESLSKLLTGEKSSITTVDGMNTYSLNDLKETIGEIIPDPTFQKSISVHIAEIDSSFNPKDHSDHISSANLILNVMDNKTPYHLYNYVEYHTNNLPINIFPEEYQINVGTWGATTSGISDFGHNSTWDEVHNSWLGRQYFTKHLISD